MSMNAVFVQVEQKEAAKFQAKPELAEALFEAPQPVAAHVAAMGNLTPAMQDRVRTAGPQMFASVLSRFDARTREALEARIGMKLETLASGEGGDALLKLMQDRSAKAAEMAAAAQNRPTLSLDKDWHGLHYLLTGSDEPNDSPLGQAVLGGSDLGDDGEGFSGYGPARLIGVEAVREISNALNDGAVEERLRDRFVPEKMRALKLYPGGFRPSDLEGLIEAFHNLRAFYIKAADAQRAIVTCIV